MQNRKQSIVTLSFDEKNETKRGYFSRIDRKKGKNAPPLGETVEKSLMALCREIAGALLGMYSMEVDAKCVRREICEKLKKTVECSQAQANSLFDLSLELVHVQSYGHYRRNPLELSLLIATATGQFRSTEDN